MRDAASPPEVGGPGLQRDVTSRCFTFTEVACRRVLVSRPGRLHALDRPILDRFFRGDLLALGRCEDGEFLEPFVLAPAEPLDRASVPQAGQVGSSIEESDLRIVAAPIVVIADVTGLVYGLDAVDKEP
jgi:hypothetical protein